MNGNNLQLRYSINNQDIITVTNQTDSQKAMERFELSDGQYLTSAQVNQVVQDMNAYASAHGITISSIDDVKGNASLMAIAAASWNAA
jgi:hypothetical protein